MQRLESSRDLRAALLTMVLVINCAWSVSAQTGYVTSLHDPSIIQSGSVFYIFSTGRGLTVRNSTDLFHWTQDGRVFDQGPAWTRRYSPNNHYWAPDISFSNGEYRLYYAVSTFGKTFSAIGLAVNKSLDRSSSDFKWIDRGKVIDTPAGNNWNAIDPCAFKDVDGKAWLVLGSCWTGIKLVALDDKTGMLTDTAQAPLSLAANPPTNIIEAGYIRRHGDFYYLWESVDHCCRGAASNYRILVGRSKNVRGPYLDFNDKPMTLGGGTLVLSSYDNVRGPGSCAIIQAAGRDFLIHHQYDAGSRGVPTLQIRQLFYTPQGWPIVGEPIQQPPTQPTADAKSVTGDWLLRYDFGAVRTITLHDDASISPAPGRWQLAGNVLTLNWTKAAKTIIEQCQVADDGSFFVGRNSDGITFNAIRPPAKK